MPVFYVARKKVDKTGDTPVERYYATAKAMQGKGKGVTGNEIGREMADASSLTNGDVQSVLEQLPSHVVWHLKQGRTVTIKGLGTFSISLGSEGAETPEACKPKTIHSIRICFRPDAEMMKLLTEGIVLEQVDVKPEKRKKK